MLAPAAEGSVRQRRARVHAAAPATAVHSLISIVAQRARASLLPRGFHHDSRSCPGGERLLRVRRPEEGVPRPQL